LQYGRGLGMHAAAFATGLIFIGWGISGPLSGWISDRIGRRKPIMILSAVFGVIFTTMFVFLPNLSQTTAYLLFFAFGITNTGVAIAYAVSTELHDRNFCWCFATTVGRAIG
jgi:MFS family permease